MSAMQEKNATIIFFGTSEFALHSLDALIRNGWAPIAVVTKPDEPAGRKQILTPPPVKEWMMNYELGITNQESRIKNQERRIQIFQPERLDQSFKDKIVTLEADLFIVAAYGKIIPKEILAIPRLGALNIHPSLLPRWRGPSPIQFAILNGDQETGVTIMQIDEELDHGPIVANNKAQIASNRTTYLELYGILAKMGAELLIEMLPKWIQGEIEPIPQDDIKATYSKILKKDDGRINWSRSAEEIERMVRAYTPWPSAWTMWPTEKIYRIRIDEAEGEKDESPFGSPGYLWQAQDASLLVKTGRGSIRVVRLTIEGKNMLRADEFLHGHPEIIGTTFV